MLSDEARKLIFENKAAYERGLKDPSQVPPPLTREQVRLNEYKWAEGMGRVYPNTSVSTENFGGTPTDVMIPKNIERKQVMFYIHGGAWAFGSAMYARLTAAYFTENCGMVALCPDYPLVPEHTVTRQIASCYNSYMAAAEKYGAENIVLAGSSAGGHLALALMQRLRAEGGQNYPLCLFLYSPVTTLSGHRDSGEALSGYDIILRGFADTPVPPQPDAEGGLAGRYMSPLNGEYDGFPPMYITCGSEEVLLDDSYLLFKKAKRAGVKAALNVRAGMWHSYPECQRDIPEAAAELKNAVSFMEDAVSGAFTL